MKSLGEKVKEFRQAHGLSTSEMAERVGVKRQNIEQLEAAGHRLPKYLVQLADAMNVSLDELLGRKSYSFSRPGPSAQEPASVYFVRPWPFSADDYDRLMRLDKRWHGHIEIAMRRAITECEGIAANGP